MNDTFFWKNTLVWDMSFYKVLNPESTDEQSGKLTFE